MGIERFRSSKEQKVKWKKRLNGAIRQALKRDLIKLMSQ